MSPRLPAVGPERSDPPERIVSLAPGTTAIVFALDTQERLVGVSRFCDDPPEAQSLPRIARFVDAADAIVTRGPDLVLTASYLQKAIVGQVIERDLTVLAFTSTGLEGVFCEVSLLGRVVDALERARALVAGWRAHVEWVVAAGLDLPTHRRVYLEEWGKLLIPAGWWLADFVELAGGTLALPQVNRRAHSRERIVELRRARGRSGEHHRLLVGGAERCVAPTGSDPSGGAGGNGDSPRPRLRRPGRSPPPTRPAPRRRPRGDRRDRRARGPRGTPALRGETR